VDQQANSLEVVSVTPDRVSERAETAERPMMVGGYVGDFVYVNTASERYYDRFYLFDEDRVPLTQTSSYGTFIGYSWTEISPFSAELRVLYPGETSEQVAFMGGVIGMFPQPSSGRLARDKTYFTAQTKRTRTLQDGIPLDGSYHLGDLIDIARGSAE
jgi:hypothetical protein